MRKCSFSTLASPRKKLVIVGTGWGGFGLLRHINKQMYDVTVVSTRNHFLFTPLLASTTVGTLEFRSIIQPVRVTKFRDESHFHLASVVDIDAKNDTIHCRSTLDEKVEYNLSYDRLVLAIGAQPNTFGIPGVSKYAYFLKEISHAREIRNRIMKNLELALEPTITPEKRRELLHFVVIGGGPTGVEFCAELFDFLSEDVKYYFPKESKDVRVSLIEGRKILGAFDERLRGFALKKIQSRPQMKLISNNVREVKENSILLDNGEEIPCGLVVWSAGIGPQVLTEHLKWPKSPQHPILCNQQFRVNGCLDLGKDNVYAIGDCSSIEGYPLPATAQVAESQAIYLAKFLTTDTLEPYHFRNKGLLAYLGGYQALTELPRIEFHVGSQKDGGLHAWTPSAIVKGWLSWVIWRSAYLTKLGTWRLRMQVPIDWFKTFFMGRDISRF